MTTIDAHTHFFPEAYFDLSRRESERIYASLTEEADGYVLHPNFWTQARMIRYGPFVPDHYDMATRVAAMDANGIGIQVLSGVQSLNYYWADSGLALEILQMTNDAMAKAIRDFPGRFQGLASIPMQSTSHALKEIDRSINELGLCGVQILTNVDGLNLDDEKFLPIFERLNEIRVPVFIHAYGSLNDARLDRNFLTNVVGFPCELAVAGVSMILSGLLDRCPDLQVYLGHGGGAFTFVMGRVERGFDAIPDLQKIRKRPSEYLDQFYVDTLVHDDDAMKFVAKKVGGDRLIFGTDWPFWMADLIVEERTRRVCDAETNLSWDDVSETNPRRLFSI